MLARSRLAIRPQLLPADEISKPKWDRARSHLLALAGLAKSNPTDLLARTTGEQSGRVFQGFPNGAVSS